MYLATNADLDRIYTKREFELGARFKDEQAREFVFIKMNTGDGAVTNVAGYLAVALNSSYPDYEVTTDLDSATIKALVNMPIGFIQAVLTNGTYGWAQYKGKNRKAMSTDGGADAGDLMFAEGSTNVGRVATGANNAACTYTKVAVAMAADSGNSQAIGTAFIDIDI